MSCMSCCGEPPAPRVQTISLRRRLQLRSVLTAYEGCFMKRPRSQPTESPLSRWLTSLATTPCITNLDVNNTMDCGVGAFAPAAGIKSGGVIASIPIASVITAQSAASSPLGAEISRTVESNRVVEQPNPRFVMWLYMAAGRADATHPHHPYLASLPSELADVSSWTCTETVKLEGTNLGAAIHTSRLEIETEIEKYLQPLKATNLAMLKQVSPQSVRWAKAVYNSRSFPSSLLPDCESHDALYDEVSIMLPLLDTLNHKRGTKIEWRRAPGRIQFANLGGAIEGGTEVFNNYGGKCNEDLLMCYGFTIENNLDDCYRLELVVGGAPGGSNQSLGTFNIHRGDTDERVQFPPELWVALASLYEGDEEAGESEQLAVGIEEIELLKECLATRVVPFDATRCEDESDEVGGPGHKVRAIASYRCGQGEVLRQAIATLDEMLDSC